MFGSSKDNIYNLYASLRADFKTEDDVELNKYFGLYMDRGPYGSIFLSHICLSQSIINIIPVVYKSTSKTIPAVNPPLARNEGAKTRKITLITYQK